MKECTVKKVGSNAIELHFKTRQVEFAQKVGNCSVFIKFKEPCEAFVTPPGKRVFEKGRK